MIARAVLELAVIAALSGAAAVGTWAVTGGPEIEATCDPAELKEGYICFADAAKLPGWCGLMPALGSCGSRTVIQARFS